MGQPCSTPMPGGGTQQRTPYPNNHPYPGAQSGYPNQGSYPGQFTGYPQQQQHTGYPSSSYPPIYTAPTTNPSSTPSSYPSPYTDPQTNCPQTSTARPRLCDFIGKIDFLATKMSNEYSSSLDNPCRQISDFGDTIRKDITFDELKDAFPVFVKKVSIKNYPPKEWAQDPQYSTGTHFVACDIAKALAKLLGQVVEEADDPKVTAAAGELLFNSWLDIVRVGPHMTLAAVLGILADDSMPRMKDYVPVNGWKITDDALWTLPSDKIVTILKTMDVSFECPKDEDDPKHYGYKLRCRFSVMIESFTANQLAAVQSEFLDVYYNYHKQLPTVPEELAKEMKYTVLYTGDKFEYKNPYVNLKNMETFKKHIAMIKDMGCSDAMGEDTPVAEVCFRTLKRIIKVLTEDKGTMLEDVFDNLMKAVVAISKRPKGRTYGNRIYRCYNYQLFEVMRDRGKAPSDEVFKSCQHMISEVLSSEEVSSVMEGMLKKAQEGIIKKIEIKQESTSEAGEVNDEEIHLILKTHADEVVGGPSRRVTVSRKQVWQSTVNFITARRRVNSDGLLMVRFVGDDLVEDAVDQGGPRREFFRLLVPDMCQKSGMLQFLKGNDGPLTLRPNVKQLADGFFKILGKVIALILVQEGPPVHIFTPSLVKYIVSGTTSGIKPQPTEACDGHVRVGLAKLQEAETGEEFQTALNEFCDWRLSVDGLGGCLMLKDKQKFIEMVSFHFGLTVIQPMADQLMEGLQTYNVLQLMQSNPALATLLTYKPEKCTAAIVLKHLKPVYSSEGSQRQGLEELVMVQLTQFVSSAEAGDLIDLIPEEDIESEAMEQFVRSISPGHVLEYATGSSQKPAGGFRDQPTIQFVHDPHKYLPAANTCSYELILFANEETCTSRFATFMAKALMNGVVFSAL